jgi:effector-binding domain-containing protein
LNFFFPAKYHYSKSIEITTEAEEAFNLVNTMKNWEKWSPWQEKDPKAVITYEGSESGKGSAFRWKSNNDKVSYGKMTIIDSKPLKSVTLNLEFEDMKGSTILITFDEQKGKTLVTWNLNSDMNFFMRWAGFMMDKMLGPDFEKGLSNIKKICESIPKLDLKIGETLVPAMNLICITDSTSHTDYNEISNSFEKAYSELGKFVGKKKLTMVGPPLAINIEYKSKYIFDACFPIKEDKVKNEGRIKFVMKPETKAVMGFYRGSYESLERVYGKLHEYIKRNNLTIDGYTWEKYLNDPMSTPKDKLETLIYFPIK